MAEMVDAVVVFTEGLGISENGFSAGGAIFPFRFIRRALSFNIVGWPNTLRLLDIVEVKEENEGFVSFYFGDGTKTVCPKSKIKFYQKG